MARLSRANGWSVAWSVLGTILVPGRLAPTLGCMGLLVACSASADPIGVQEHYHEQDGAPQDVSTARRDGTLLRTDSPSAPEAEVTNRSVHDAGAADRRFGSRPLGSGRWLCQFDNDCLGLACEHASDVPQGACVDPCAEDADCDPGQRCIGSGEFAPSCFSVCKWPTQCELGYSCIDYLDDGTYACLPTSWVQERHEE